MKNAGRSGPARPGPARRDWQGLADVSHGHGGAGCLTSESSSRAGSPVVAVRPVCPDLVTVSLCHVDGIQQRRC